MENQAAEQNPPVTSATACKESTSLISNEDIDKCCPRGRCRCCDWFRGLFPLSAKTRVGIIGGSWGLLTGIERVIILPTLWLYLNKFHSSAGAQFYGATLAGFNLLPLLCNPLFGWLSQRRFARVRLLIVVANLLEICGNFIYFTAPAPWLVFFGRFVAGAGSAAEPPLYADVVRVTSKKERTSFMVHLLLVKQFGIIAGPALTMLMHPIHAEVNQFVIDVYNSPGLFMAFLWAIHTIAVILVYPDIPHDSIEASAVEKSPETSEESSEQSDKTPTTESTTTICDDLGHSVRKYTDPEKLRMYFRIDIFSMIFIAFAGYFCLLAFESVLSPLLSHLFHWDEFNISLVYLGCGIEIVLIYVAFRLFLARQQERYLLLLAICLLLGAYFFNFALLVYVDTRKPAVYITLIIISTSIQVLGLTATSALPESMYTKAVPDSETDMAQGVFRTVMCVALLGGPLLGGGLHVLPWLVFILLAGIMAVCLALLVKAYPLLNYQCEAQNWDDLEREEAEAEAATAADATKSAADQNGQ
ncbi:hypothetical protein BOX15_Mlig009069g2 [Macrostomum lignano]|uniref:MFS domain-containing protein n=2 Tax=Macrostomum lignano TaxID=282301 RepID=A0A1I8G3X0_9PLAT|nr:hypothetical protein BOX15_Mlig009069g2 [Macrostomum lignano]